MIGEAWVTVSNACSRMTASGHSPKATLAGPKADARVTPPLCSRNLSYVNEYLESIV